jgi:hypothetical protein
MRAGLIVTGVLGLGTAITFGAAVVAATLFPTGASVAAQWNGGWSRDGVMVAPAMPVDGLGDGANLDPNVVFIEPEPVPER